MPAFVLWRQAGKCVVAPWDIRLSVSGAELPDALLVSCFTMEVGGKGDRGGTPPPSLSHFNSVFTVSFRRVDNAL